MPPEEKNEPINVNYRDPFLGKSYAIVKPKPQSSHGRFNKKLQPTVNLPAISYMGIVSDTKEHSKVFMIQIEKQTYLMKKGDKQAGILLESGDTKSITIKYENSRITISIAKK